MDLLRQPSLQLIKALPFQRHLLNKFHHLLCKQKLQQFKEIQEIKQQLTLTLAHLLWWVMITNHKFILMNSKMKRLSTAFLRTKSISTQLLHKTWPRVTPSTSLSPSSISSRLLLFCNMRFKTLLRIRSYQTFKLKLATSSLQMAWRLKDLSLFTRKIRLNTMKRDTFTSFSQKKTAPLHIQVSKSLKSWLSKLLKSMLIPKMISDHMRKSTTNSKTWLFPPRTTLGASQSAKTNSKMLGRTLELKATEKETYLTSHKHSNYHLSLWTQLSTVLLPSLVPWASVKARTRLMSPRRFILFYLVAFSTDSAQSSSRGRLDSTKSMDVLLSYLSDHLMLQLVKVCLSALIDWLWTYIWNKW